MNTIRITLTAAAILTVSLASQAFANGPIHHNTSHAPATPYRGNSHSVQVSYHLTHGTRFDHGYYYRGRNHTHWTAQRYDARYRCTCYFDPCCSAWYYWCQPANCYYPLNYCPYRTYCWDGCSSGSVGPVGPVPGGPGPGPVGPPPGPVGPGPGGPVPNSLPPIPAPVSPTPR